MSINSASDFNSAAELLEYLHAKFPQQRCEVDAIRCRPGHPDVLHPHRVNKYIFRGECGVFPTTVSACYRLGEAGLNQEDSDQVEKVVGAIAQWLQDNFGLKQHEAYGLIQHLELPTYFIDFTGDPEVAIAFAVGGPESSSKEVGQVCVLEVPAAFGDKRGQVAELFKHRWCERAKRQVAYGYCPLPHKCDDLKSPQATADHGVVGWFSFTVQPDDRARFGDKYRALRETSVDPEAGLLRHLINRYAAEIGKLRERVARFCAGRVPMVPLVRPLSNGQQVPDFLPPGEHLCWDEEAEKSCSLRYWSEKSAETLRPDYLSTLRPDSNGIRVTPATHHPLGIIDGCLLLGRD
jgi:hypothetical protein